MFKSPSATGTFYSQDCCQKHASQTLLCDLKAERLSLITATKCMSLCIECFGCTKRRKKMLSIATWHNFSSCGQTILLVLISRVSVNRLLTPGFQIIVQIFPWKNSKRHKCTKYAVDAKFWQSVWFFCAFYGTYLVRNVHLTASGGRESILWWQRLLAS